jgi:hypothetical protein
MTYASILKLAYTITINHPRLWFFGLFLVGGFNAVLLTSLGNSLEGLESYVMFASLVTEPSTASVILMSIILVLFSIIISNILRIILVAMVMWVLRGDQELSAQLGLAQAWVNLLPDFDPKKSKLQLKMIIHRSFKATLIASICANIFLFLAVIAIGSPQFIISGGTGAQSLFVLAILFLPLSFFALYINLFPPYFTILFGNTIRDSFRLAHDLLVSKWKEIIGFVVVLMVVYSLGFTVVFSVVHYMRNVFSYGLEIFAHLGFSSQSVIISPVRIGGAALAWLLLAVLNVFSNVALLILFINLLKPVNDEQVAEFANGYRVPAHAPQK